MSKSERYKLPVLYKTRFIFLIITIIFLVSGSYKQEYPNYIEKNEFGLCYRDDIKQDEIGFLNNNPSRQEIIERLGWPLHSHTFQDKSYLEGGKIVGYCYTYMLDTSPLVILFDLKYNVVRISASDITEKIDDISCINDYEKTKYYKPIRYDITEKELDFIKKGVTADSVQEKLGAPHGYLYKTMYVSAAPDTVSNIFLYKLEDGKILYFSYGISGEVKEAGYIDEKLNAFYENHSY